MNFLFIPPHTCHRTVQDLYSDGTGTLRSTEGRQRLRRAVSELNANERWQSAARTLHGLYMRTPGERWEGACWVSTAHRAPFCVSHPDPQPTSNDRPLSRTLTERSSGISPRTLENVANFWHVKNSPRPHAFSDDPRRPPTTYNGHRAPLLRPPTSSNIRLRSAPFS